MWLRRELRLLDNPALAAAAATGGPRLHLGLGRRQPLGYGRRGSLVAGAFLDARLRVQGLRLVVRKGQPAAVLAGLAREVGAAALHYTPTLEPGDPSAQELQRAMGRNGADLRVVAHRPNLLFDEVRAARRRPVSRLHGLLARLPRPWGAAGPGAHGGARDGSAEMAGRRAAARDPRARPGARGRQGSSETGNRARRAPRPASPGSSPSRSTTTTSGATCRPRTAPRASLHISTSVRSRPGPSGRPRRRRPRSANPAGSRAQAPSSASSHGGSSPTTFSSITRRHPNSLFARSSPSFPGRRMKEIVAAWRAGLTGYPLVDAGLRQLWTTGWMHNRVRMVPPASWSSIC